MLIALDQRVLSTQSSAAAGRGYPVLPIAIVEDRAAAAAAAAAGLVWGRPAGGKPEPEPEPEGPTVAELVEGLARARDGRGGEITRDEDSLPSSIRLPTGATEWRDLGKPGSERMVRVVLIERASREGCGLRRRVPSPSAASVAS